MSEATRPQLDLIQRLVPQLQAKMAQTAEHPNAVAVTAMVTGIQATLVNVIRGDAVTKSDASTAIGQLIAADKLLTVAVSEKAVAEHPGIGQAQKVIPNRFSKACSVCKSTVDEAAGFAALQNGQWRTFCQDCASESLADRQARQKAEERKLAQAEARRIAEKAKLAEYSSRIIVRANCDDLADPKIRVAVPSPRKGQEYDFFIVTRTEVHSFIGGQGEQRIGSVAAQIAAAKRILAVDVIAGMTLFGQHTDTCARCGDDLTVTKSTERGFGPYCYGKVMARA